MNKFLPNQNCPRQFWHRNKKIIFKYDHENEVQKFIKISSR